MATIAGYTTAQSGTRTAVISQPSGLADGDVLYLIYQGIKTDSAFGGASVTLPAGFSGIANTDDSGPITGIAYKYVTSAGSEPATYTVSGNINVMTKMQAVLIAIRGVSATDAYRNTPSRLPRYTSGFDSTTQVNAYSPTGVNGLNGPTDAPLSAIQVMSGYGGAISYTPGDYAELVTLNQTGLTTFGTSANHLLQVRTWLNIPTGTTSATDPQLITSGFSGPPFEIRNTAGFTVVIDTSPDLPPVLTATGGFAWIIGG